MKNKIQKDNMNPRVLVLRTAGTNCDAEAVFAFRSVGADVDLLHINQLFQGKAHLQDYHILVIPGGFSYGDDIMSGKILANELRLRLGDQLHQFINDGKLILGICNGFQVLVRAGILPGPLDGSWIDKSCFQQTTTLTYNDSGKFEDRWIHLHVDGHSVWTEGMNVGAGHALPLLFLPVAHGEGKFVPADVEILKKLRANDQIVFRYVDRGGHPAGYPDNPNGSIGDIAGISDSTGRILGLMPHPERHFLFTQHPFWTRLDKKTKFGQGANIFENGVRYVRENLLSPSSVAARG